MLNLKSTFSKVCGRGEEVTCITMTTFSNGKRQVAILTVEMLVLVADRCEACDASGCGAAAQWALKASKASAFFVSTRP